MIEYIKGAIAELNPAFVVIDNHGCPIKATVLRYLIKLT